MLPKSAATNREITGWQKHTNRKDVLRAHISVLLYCTLISADMKDADTPPQPPQRATLQSTKRLLQSALSFSSSAPVLAQDSAPGFALSDVPPNLQAALSSFDLDNDGHVSFWELANAALLLREARSKTKRMSCMLVVAVVLMFLLSVSTSIITTAFMKTEKEMHTNRGVLYDNTGNTVATAQAIELLGVDLGTLPRYEGHLDFHNIKTITLHEVPPFNATLGFHVEGFVWYNSTEMDLTLNLGYTIVIRSGTWTLHSATSGPSNSHGRALQFFGGIINPFNWLATGLRVSIHVAQTGIDASSQIAQRIAAATEVNRVCGNFCGPGWCNNGYTAEADCSNALAGASESGSCADRCCQLHDYCCYQGANREIDSSQYGMCNQQVVSCLRDCDVSYDDGTCTTEAGDNYATRNIIEFMDKFPYLCCGGPCPY